MNLTVLHKQIIYLDYPTQRELTETFLRFQEHYESPKFRGQVFTLGQYRRWYAEDRGSFSYYTDWSGMNIPSFVFDAFKAGLFDPLSPQEQSLLDLFKDRGDKFYVIAGYGRNKVTKGHEIAHALYYVDPTYKAEVDEQLAAIPIAKYVEIGDKLKSLGYCDEVIADEIQAYMSEGHEEFIKRPGVELDKCYFPPLQAIKAKRGIQ